MRWFSRRRNFEREMADELASHIAHRADDLTAAGISREDAERQARIELGAVETYKEAARDERWLGRTRRAVEQTTRDLRLAARRLRRAPVFTTFSVVSIGVGAGVTTAMFSILYATLWAPMGVRDADRVGLLGNQLQGVPSWEQAVSLADFEDYRRAQHSFASLAATSRTYQAVSTGAGAELMQGEAVTGDYFALLGVEAVLGRMLQPQDATPGATPVAVISYRCWQSRFAGDPNVVGRRIRIDGVPFDIVGVTARAYHGFSRQPLRVPSYWIPMSTLAVTGAYRSPLERPDDHSRLSLSVVGRLASGTSMAQADAEADGISRALDQSFRLNQWLMTSRGRQEQPGERGWLVRPIANPNDSSDAIVGRAAVALLAIIGMVLAVACTNLANLSLARGESRHQELAVRLALGASRGRLIRELAAESVVIGVLGFGVAVLVSMPIMRLAAGEVPMFNGMAAPVDAHFNVSVVLAAASAVALALLICGLWPAIKLSRADVKSVIASGGGTGTKPWRGQRALIRAQMIVSVAFFCTAAVFISALAAQVRYDPGIDLDHLTVARTAFRLQRWDDARSRRAADAIASAPASSFGFQSVALSSSMPFGANVYVYAQLTTDGDATREQATLLMASTPGIFNALGIPLVKGRAFDQRDVAGSVPVVVLSETAALRLFGTTDVVGREVQMRGGVNSLDEKTVEPRTVIGVTRDTDTGDLMMGGRRVGVSFVPIAQRYEPLSFVVARGETDAGAGSLRALIQSADPDAAVDTAGSGLVMLGGVWLAARIVAAVAFGIGLVTLVLTMIGLSGILAHVVTRRTREIGIRKALGADARSIAWLILKDGGRPVVSGTAIGLALGTLGGFLVRAAMPLSAAPVQPLAIALVLAVVVPATLVACYVPARRASRVEPNLTLKEL